jgi:hypothetical protein
MRLRSADDSVATEEGQQVGLSVSSTPRVGRETGSWALALIVLVASVMIPLGKLVALAYLLITAQFTRRDPRPDPAVSPGPAHRPMVDAGRVRHHVHGRTGSPSSTF